MHAWVTVLQSNIQGNICMGTDFVCNSLHTRLLLYNFYLYPVIFFFIFKTTKTYIPMFQGINYVFFDWKVLCCK